MLKLSLRPWRQPLHVGQTLQKMQKHQTGRVILLRNQKKQLFFVRLYSNYLKQGTTTPQKLVPICFCKSPQNQWQRYSGTDDKSGSTEATSHLNHGGNLLQVFISLSMGYLKHFQPFLKARRWLHRCNATTLLPLAIGCPQVPKSSRCGRAWHQPRSTTIQTVTVVCETLLKIQKSTEEQTNPAQNLQLLLKTLLNSCKRSNTKNGSAGHSWGQIPHLHKSVSTTAVLIPQLGGKWGPPLKAEKYHSVNWSAGCLWRCRFAYSFPCQSIPFPFELC